MSKILESLMAAERLRRDVQERRTPESSTLDAERDAEAVALAAAGAAENGVRLAAERCRQESELLAVAQRRYVAEELAMQQAQARAATEAEAEAIAAERAHAERMLENAVRLRIDAEQRALADAKRRELAATELATAAASRAKREQEAEGLAKERAASERRAVELASEKVRAEQIAEAAVLARTAAERDALLQTERRVAQEHAAHHAMEARQDAEQSGNPAFAGNDSARPIKVKLPAKPSLTAADNSPPQTFFHSGLGAAAIAVVGVLAGLGIGLMFGDLSRETGNKGPRIAGTEAPLQLDRELRVVPQPTRVIQRDKKK
jgi:hypothetical protein